ncbi:DUF397 domain-containing protein [Actinoplanes sp. NPDC048796]|uniref:DUF397 domain-containing protein n=1 Tax=unclassified Actinoplanes TaxID=2626549 RepID=UPI0033CACE4C
MTRDSITHTDRTWLRSSRCVGEAHCVELSVIDSGERVALRNSQRPGTVLTFDAAEWRNFMDGLKTGELRLSR